MRFAQKLMILGLFTLVACASAVYLPRLQTVSNDISFWRLSDCSLPCWIGIVPGQTTIGQARKLIQDRYGQAFDVEVVETNKDYTLAYVLSISARDRSGYLSVYLNESANKVQHDTSLVHEIKIYSFITSGENNSSPKVGDWIIALGQPECLAPQWGHHTAWPTMLYPQYRTKVSFGTSDFKVTPYLVAGLMLSDQPLVCNERTIPWRGFHGDYPIQFTESMLP